MKNTIKSDIKDLVSIKKVKNSRLRESDCLECEATKRSAFL